MTISNRTFGVEIEFIGDRARAVRAIQEADVECSLEGYNHYTRSTWKCVTDGSVDGGGEIVSPILRGEEGIATLKTVLRALAGGNFRVNSSCGIHVHVGARDLNVSQIRTIVKRYAHNESVIDSMMPRSRRGRNNMYCQPVNYANSLDRATSVDQLYRMIRGRYYKLNLMSIARHGTIEFRQHSGSLNSSKVANWVKFCLNFVDSTVAMMADVDRTATVPSSSAPTASTSTGRSYRRGSKAARILSLLGSSTFACDADYLARQVDSTRNSVMVMISNMRRDGHSIRRRNGRYYLDTAAAATPARRPTSGSRSFPRTIAGVSTGRNNSIRRRYFEYLCTDRSEGFATYLRRRGARRINYTYVCSVTNQIHHDMAMAGVSTSAFLARMSALGFDFSAATTTTETTVSNYNTVVRTDCFQGLDRSVVSFFQERIQDLAS